MEAVSFHHSRKTFSFSKLVRAYSEAMYTLCPEHQRIALRRNELRLFQNLQVQRLSWGLAIPIGSNPCLSRTRNSPTCIFGATRDAAK